MGKVNKVLLLGEFSNLHNMLALSLQEYGIKAFVVGSPNGFRGLKAELSLSSSLPGYLGRVHTALKPMLNFYKLMNYDVVQAITYEQFHPMINDSLLYLISKSSKKFCSLCTGCDSYLYSYFTGDHAYPTICSDCLQFDQKRSDCRTTIARSVRSQERLYDLSSRIIPMQYEYRESLLKTSFSGKVTQVHRLPFSSPGLSTLSPRRLSGQSRPLRIAHGLNRYGFKGTKIVDGARKILEQENIKDVQLEILTRMPLDKYLTVLTEYDAVIDQLYAESYGYNALYSMSMGLPVISGTTQRALSALGVSNNPFIFSPPSARGLIDVMRTLNAHRSLLEQHSQMSIDFVRTAHSPDNTIPQYLSTWSNL